MVKPELSIIMPCYNVAELIPRAIESVLRQTFVSWELIVVDDGSPDNLHDVVEQYATIDSRISIISKKNGGLSDARNVGLSKAIGNYIHFFDPDDYLYCPDWYESVFKQISDSPTCQDLIITGYYVGYETSQKTVNIVDRPLLTPFGGRCGEECIKHVCYAWNKFFRREFLIANNLQYEKGLSRIEDAEFMSRLVQYQPIFQFIQDSGYVYVQRSEQTLSKGFDSMFIDICNRRIGIDMILVDFFNNNIIPKTELIDCLKIEALVSLINRLYSFGKHLSKDTKRKILANTVSITPDRFIYSQNGHAKNLYDFIIYWSVKNRQYWLTDIVQKIRLRLRVSC